MAKDNLKYKITRGVKQALRYAFDEWKEDLEMYSPDDLIEQSRLFCEIMNEYALDLMEETFEKSIETETDLDDPEF